jgi:hypothetical protein
MGMYKLATSVMGPKLINLLLIDLRRFTLIHLCKTREHLLATDNYTYKKQHTFYCVTEDLFRQTITLLLTSTRILTQVRYGIIFHNITNNVN